MTGIDAFDQWCLPQILNIIWHDIVRNVMGNKIILKLFQCFISRVTTVGGYVWNKTLKYFQNYFKSFVSHVSTSETEIKLFQPLKEF